MTGFGMAEGPARGGRLQVEIRTVNHKHLSVQLRLPTDLQALESELRDALRQRLERGHVSLSARWQEEADRPPAVRLNLERAREIVGALRELKTALGLPGDVDLAFVARQPDVLAFGETEVTPASWAEIEPIVRGAVDAVLVMREREGRALAVELERQLAVITTHAQGVVTRAPGRIVAERDRLRKTVSELLDGRSVDENRLAQEIALLADRLDISEELTRLETHVSACRATLRETTPVGRRLGFLGQELLREINTVGSKANDAAIAQAVIEMKGELEKFREQIENIE
jgi:uncharacterized protein (TIGR00255 family)